MQVWLDEDGRQEGLLELVEARTSVLDRGLTIGAGIFETLKVVDGTPFALTRHLRRLRASAEALGIAVPSDERLRDAVAAVAAVNAHLVGARGRMRITLTQGAGHLANPYAGDARPTLLVTVAAISAASESAVVRLSPYRRNELSALTGVKSTSYAENAIALHQAVQEGGDEALLLNTAGAVCEGTGSNIFLVVDGDLVTPELASGCLAGITRELVLEWCGGSETAIDGTALAGVSEAFLTSSTRDVWPVRELAGRQLSALGPVTAEIMRSWRRHSQADLDP